GVGGVGAMGAVGADDCRVPHVTVRPASQASVAVDPDLHGVGKFVGGQGRVGGEVDGEVFGPFFAVGGVDDAEDVELHFGGFDGHGDRLLWLVVCGSYSLTKVGLWHKGFRGFLGTFSRGSSSGSGGSGYGRDSTARQAKPFP